MTDSSTHRGDSFQSGNSFQSGDFPLYTMLTQEKISKKDLPAAQKNSFIKKVTKLDKPGKELMYALIKYYHHQNSDDMNLYDGLVTKTSAGFDFDSLPVELKHILLKFVLMILDLTK